VDDAREADPIEETDRRTTEMVSAELTAEPQLGMQSQVENEEFQADSDVVYEVDSAMIY
jgi:hypothetical protein